MRFFLKCVFLFAGVAGSVVAAEPPDLPLAYQRLAKQLGQTREPTGDIKCGFPLVAFLQENRGLVDAQLSALLDRAVTQKSILRGNFRIHYDTTGVHAAALLDENHDPIPNSADAFADSVAVVANHVLEVETDPTGLGYPAPPPDFGNGGGDEYDIYIQELGNVYGLTTPETQGSGLRYTTYITIDNDFAFVRPDGNKGVPALKVTMAHEFHHAIQIGAYAFWGFEEIHYYEMTAVWMEDIVYTEVNDYYEYLSSGSGHFRNPDIPFTSTTIIMYSRAIWCHYLAKRYGQDMIKRTWEQVASTRPLEAIDLALEEASTDFRTAFAEWTLWNHFTGSRADTSYYPEGALYPLVTQQVTGFTPPSRAIGDELGALTGRYYQVLFNADTLTLVLTNINFAEAGSPEVFGYTYRLNVLRVDETYGETEAGIFVKLDVPDPTNWFSRSIVNGGVAPANIKTGLAFPNPFVVDGRSVVSITTSATSPVTGSLSIFSTGMNRVYSATTLSTLTLGKYVFVWNGRGEDNKLVESGVYLFFLELPDYTLKGKIAVMRK